MKNRAKCLQCEKIIESIHSQDYQLCDCGEIFVDGGKENLCGAKDWKNFVRIDDNGNAIVPTIVNDESEGTIEQEKEELPLNEKKTRLLAMMKNMIDSYENLPQNARFTHISHYDFQAALLLIYEIVKIS